VTRRLAAAAAALGLLLAACGSDDDSAGSTTSTPTTTAGEASSVAPPDTEAGTTTEAPTTSAQAATTTTAPAADFDAVAIDLEMVTTLAEPIAMAVRDGDDALYVAERAGRVVRLETEGAGVGDPQLVLDISGEVDTSVERGLLGLAFSPTGEHLFVHWSDAEGATRLTEFRAPGFAADDSDEGTAVEVDLNSRREIFRLDQPFPNHNGGDITFGPDGYLYLALGDGGAGGDPLGAGQDLVNPLGSIVRIDPSVEQEQAHGTYGIPEGNIGGTELYISGVRNPWRISFDRDTDELWVADVGQDQWEEINRLPAGEIGGTNLGWNLQEGRHDFAGGIPDNYVAPVAEYDHDQGVSVTGGYVYRGSAIPDLRGAYVFGDYAEARLWAIPPFTGDTGEIRELGVSVREFGLVSFGQDRDGELYVLHSDGPVYRIVAG